MLRIMYNDCERVVISHSVSWSRHPADLFPGYYFTNQIVTSVYNEKPSKMNFIVVKIMYFFFYISRNYEIVLVKSDFVVLAFQTNAAYKRRGLNFRLLVTFTVCEKRRDSGNCM